MTSVSKSIKSLLLATIAVTAPGLTTLPAGAADESNPNWPCVQRKVENLTPAQVWDGPSIEGVKEWWSDKDVMTLINTLAARRTTPEDAEKAVQEFAAAQPEDKRDERLTLVFAGLFDKVNSRRRGIISGIEKYQKAQESRATTIEEMGSKIVALEMKLEANPDDQALADQLKKERDNHEWAARIFQEKQNNVPLACEVPVLVDQHLYQMAQLIRQSMSE
jgi:hypothetical protein